MSSRAILMVNLGTPDSADVAAVRRYLNEFLMDPCVIDLPWPLRRLLVGAFILPFRPRRSAAAYRTVWLPEGSPLKVISQRLAERVQAHTALPVALAMRYGQPSIEQKLLELAAQPAVREIVLLPQYPHYAMSSVKTCVDKTQSLLDRHKLSVKVLVHPVFYRHPAYIRHLVARLKPHLLGQWDHLLFSYHGVPLRHIRRDDPSGHCLTPDCCNRASQAHARCYRHQVHATTDAVVKEAGIADGRWSLSFQSRLGKDKWLTPSTEQTVKDLAARGIRRLLVICPGFTVDCLETLEEIGHGVRETFMAHGGEHLVLLPCLNDDPQWAATMAEWAESLHEKSADCVLACRPD